MSNLKQQTKWNQVLNNLPSNFQRHHGYHSHCYKKSTTYSVRSPSNGTASTNQFVSTRCIISSTSSSGVLPACHLESWINAFRTCSRAYQGQYTAIFSKQTKFSVQYANKLGKYILYLEQKPLEEPLTVENIMEGEVEIPESLKEFYKILYTGNASLQRSPKKSHETEGSSADAVFTCSGGKLIPGKHLSLGLTAKSLIGSKTIVSLLNRFDRIDLDLEETLFKTKILVPSHTIRKSNLSTGLAWDNFDINMETSSGANTLYALLPKHVSA